MIGYKKSRSIIEGKYVLILENDAYRVEIEDLIQEKMKHRLRKAEFDT
jgi:hypothetical protein